MDTKAVAITFDCWPDRALFPNKAGNTLHWSQRSDLRLAEKEKAYWMAYGKLKEPFKKASIQILVTAKDNRRRDLDSLLSAVKPWLDGLVLAGLVKDDNYFIVPEITVKFLGVFDRESVVIIVTEVIEEK